MKFIVKYARHGGTYEEECDTIEEAFSYIRLHEDEGNIYAIELNGVSIDEAKFEIDDLRKVMGIKICREDWQQGGKTVICGQTLPSGKIFKCPDGSCS